jgi:ATP-dependent Clp protease ATP-binding subunit ClpB
LSIEDSAKEKLALSGFSPKYGARPIVGVIRSQLRRPLARMIISGELRRGSSVGLTLDEAENIKWTVE